MSEFNKLSVGELEILHEEIGLTVEVNDGEIMEAYFEEVLTDET